MVTAALILALAAGLALFGWYALGGRKAGQVQTAVGPRAGVGPLFTFEPFIVNIAGSNGERYLKAVLTIELSREADRKEITEKEVLLRDKVIDVLSSKSFSQLDGSDEHQVLRIEIAYHMNALLRRARVNAVYFSEFVMQ